MTAYGKVKGTDEETSFLDEAGAPTETESIDSGSDGEGNDMSFIVARTSYQNLYEQLQHSKKAKRAFLSVVVAFVLLVGVLHSPHHDSEHRQNQVSLTSDKYQSLSEVPLRKKNFLPEQFLEKYKAKHSKQALDAEIKQNGQVDPNRKYVVARYQCPERAGNWINYFTWYFIVGMLMDRTVVWQYDPDHDKLDPRNRCEQVLEIADWVPEYDPKIHGFQPNDIVTHRYNAATKHYFREGNDSYKKRTDFSNMKAVSWFEPHRLTRSGQMWYHDFVIHNDDRTHDFWFDMLDLHNMTEYNRKIFHLYDQGHSYLKGMLFDDIIKMKPWVYEAVEPYLQHHAPDEITIGIHARHHTIADDGTDLHGWGKCLEDMLNVLDTEDKPCTVYIATDRPIAVTLLSEAATKRNCQAVHVNHEEETKDMTQMSKNAGSLDFHDKIVLENGAFAGAPFFEDLALLSAQVRTGFIHTAGYSVGSSASTLIWQQIVYNGIQDGSFTHPPMDCSGANKAVREIRTHGPA